MLHVLPRLEDTPRALVPQVGGDAVVPSHQAHQAFGLMIEPGQVGHFCLGGLTRLALWHRTNNGRSWQSLGFLLYYFNTKKFSTVARRF
jgi:hypothetical protein